MVERRNIYEVCYKDFNKPFKFVVLYVGRRTLTIMYLSEFEDPFTKVNASLNRIETRTWSWFDRNRAKYVGQMPKSKYQKILHLAFDLFSGNLLYSNDNMQYYYDEDDIAKSPEQQDTSKSDEDTKHDGIKEDKTTKESEVAQNPNDAKKNSLVTLIRWFIQDCLEPCEDAWISTSECYDAFQEFAGSEVLTQHYFSLLFYPEVEWLLGAKRVRKTPKGAPNAIWCVSGIRFSKDTHIPSESGLIKEVHADGTVLYDIMSIDYVESSTGGTGNHQAQHKTARTNDKHFRLFTLDEVESIALLEANIVTQIYSVSKSVAYTMIRNAKAIVGLEYPKKNASIIRWSEYFSDGYTDEQIRALTGFSIGKIANIRKIWKADQNGDPNNIDACKEALSKMSKYDLACELELSRVKLAQKYGITNSDMDTITQDIRKNVLAANLFYLAFGSIAYDRDAFIEKVEHARTRSKKRISIKNDIIVFVYDSLKKIESIYTKTLNDHAAILAGDADIPDEITDERERKIYYSAIKKRFAGLKNDRMYELDTVQKAIKENDIYDLAVYMLETSVMNLQYAIQKFKS